MNTMQAFLMGVAHRDSPMKVFDWCKAATVIAERHPSYASAGLEGDLEYTEGCIWKTNCVPERGDSYLASVWATPLLLVEGEEIECWKLQSETPGWDAQTYWPKEAIDILIAAGNPQLDHTSLLRLEHTRSE